MLPRNMAMSRQKKLDKMSIELQIGEARNQNSISGKSYTWTLYKPDLVIGTTDVRNDWILHFERNQKVAIVGANGIGKTTLP